MSRAIPALLLVVGAAATASANPISIEVLRARQVPRTHHVQVTFGVDLQISAEYTPGPVNRDGQQLGVAWGAPGTTFRTNTGSGVQATRARQLCDCDAPVGPHSYSVTFAAGGRMETLERRITVVADLAEVTDAGPPADMFPWDIPDPVEIQGLDCVAACNATPAADMAAAPGGPEPATCSVGGVAGVGAVALVGLAGVLLLLRRRPR